MFFGKMPHLWESDPKNLSLEDLSVLQGALMAKLLLTSRELEARYASIASLSELLPNSDQSRATLVDGAKRLRGLALILEHELALDSRQA